MRRRFLPAFLPLFLLLVVGLVGCGGSSKPVTVSINAPASTNIDPGDSVTLSVTVDNDSTDKGVTWTLTGTGCTGSACGVLSGNTSTSVTYTAPATVTTAFTVTITATSVKTASVTNTITLNIPANPAITTALGALTAGQVGSAYTVTVAISGGVSPYAWTVTSGNLPTGLTLGASTGTISGTPTASGNYTFTLQVTDSGTPTALTASGTFTIDISAAPAITFSTMSLASSVLGDAYASQVTATGGAGTLTYAVTTGTLPAGLTMTAAGAITGKSTAAGTSSFTVTASDAYGDSAKDNLAITIDPVISVTTASLPSGYVGTAYTSTTLAATGGLGTPYTWTWAAASGSLPAGLNLSTAGVISGTPTTAGTYSVVVTARDSAGNTGSATLSIVIESPLTITTPTTLPAGEVSNPFSQKLAAQGGTGSGYTWSTNSQGTTNLGIVGLSLSTTGQVIGASPIDPISPASQTETFQVTVTDSASHTASATMSVTIYASMQITSTLPTGYVGTAYSGHVSASGGDSASYTWTWSGASPNSLPPGLTLVASGAVTGTPTSAGNFLPQVTVKDAAGFTSMLNVPLTVDAGVTVTPISLPNGYPGTAYSSTQLAATGGKGTPYTWTWAAATGSLPAGLALSSAGAITGTPTTAGSYNVVVTAKDSAGNTGSLTLPLVVEAKLAFTPTSLPTGALSETYPNTTLTPSGGSGSGYTFSATGLPPGLVLSTAGVLSGKPTTQGTYNSVVVTLTDSASHTSNTTLSIIINASLAITTASPLPYATVGTLYSQQLTATGGTGTLTWTATGSNLGGFTLGLSGTGLVSGTPNGSGTANFTANVRDATGATASVPLTFPIYNALSQNPSALPLTATTGVAYSGTIQGTGGSGTYCWVASGLPSDGLSGPRPNTTSPTCPYIGSSFPISGTPTGSANVTVVVTMTDSTTGASVARSYTIVVSNPTPLALPTPNPNSLPSATVNQSYTGSITASGGIGPYRWKINNVVVSGTATLSDNLTATASGETLSVSGTPTSTGSVPLTNVTVTDSEATPVTAGPDTYSIAVNSLSQISGQIILTTGCGGVTLPPVTLTINTSPQQQTTSDGSGNYSFSNVPNGTYTITPSITGASSVFYPAALTGVSVNNNPISGENFFAQLGYNVSGTINYSGTQTGPTYITLDNANCGGGSSGFGTGLTQSARVAASGAYTIHGVAPGVYNVYAIMDTLNTGEPNATDPSGTSGTTTTVINADVTGAVDTLIDPTITVPTAVPQFQAVNPANNGVVILYGPVKTNSIESATSYDVQWSTTSAFTTAFTYSFPANGTGTDIWILNNGLPNMPSTFTNGNSYYFRARANTSAGNGPWAVFSGSTPTGSTPTAVTIGSNTSGSTISGTVTIPSTVTVAPGAVLYAGFFDGSTGAIYADRITSPSNSTPNPYTVVVPNGSGYIQFAILDQNNNGIVGAGDVSNADNSTGSTVTISTSMMGVDESLPGTNVVSTATTQFYLNNLPGPQTQTGYNIAYKLRAADKLPIAAELLSGPHVISPVDISNYCQGCGHPQFQTYMNIVTDTPAVGDTYSFLITYSDGTSETVTTAVTGWNGTNAVGGAAALPTSLSPTVTSSTTTPTFTWTYPPNPADYVYQFVLSENNGSEIWQIPDQNSNYNGFTSAQLPQPPGLGWNNDPTESGNPTSVGALNSGQQYNWLLEVQDSYGNQVEVSWYFVP